MIIMKRTSWKRTYRVPPSGYTGRANYSTEASEWSEYLVRRDADEQKLTNVMNGGAQRIER